MWKPQGADKSISPWKKKRRRPWHARPFCFSSVSSFPLCSVLWSSHSCSCFLCSLVSTSSPLFQPSTFQTSLPLAWFISFHRLFLSCISVTFFLCLAFTSIYLYCFFSHFYEIVGLCMYKTLYWSLLIFPQLFNHQLHVNANILSPFHPF